MKNKYIPPVMEIFEFKDEEIITTSNLSDALLGWANGENSSDAEIAGVAGIDAAELGQISGVD